MGDIYSDTDALSQRTTQIVAKQSSGVFENYPADYLYYPLKGEDGKPLITKVDGEHYSAWMKRSGEGEPFTDLVLLTKNQVDNIYAASPDAKPDVKGGAAAKSFENTGKQVYINPDRNIEIDAASVSEVHYNVKTGEIVKDSVAIDANYEAYESGKYDENTPSMPYKKVLLPNNLVGDGRVSPADLDHALNGYRLKPQRIAVHSQDSIDKAVAEGFLRGEIGRSINYLVAAKGGNFAPQMAIDTLATVSGVQNITFEAGLQGKQNVLEALPANNKVADHYARLEAQVVAAALAKQEKEVKPQEKTAEFNEKAAVVDLNQVTKLDKHLETLDKKLESGASDSSVNRVISNGVLSYLNKIHGNETLFASESTRAISALRERGLDAHADILAKYSQDPKDEFRDAKKLLRDVESQSEVEKPASKPEPEINEETRAVVTPSETLEETQAAMGAMQAALTSEFIDGSLKKLGVDTDNFSVENYHRIMEDLYEVIKTAAEDENTDIEEALSPANIKGILQEQMRSTLEEINSAQPEKRHEELEQNYGGASLSAPPAMK